MGSVILDAIVGVMPIVFVSLLTSIFIHTYNSTSLFLLGAKEKKLYRRLVSLLSQFLRPETPLYLLVLAVSVVICIILAIIIGATFHGGIPSARFNFTLENYSEILFYPLMPSAALNTLILSLGTVMVACFFAIPLAWLIHRTNIPLKKLFVALILVNVLLPGFIKVIGWIMLLSPEIGIINQFLRIFIPIESGPLSLYNLPFMMFIQGTTLTPVLFLMLGGTFMAIDPTFEESADICGSSKFQTLRSITLPLVKPGLVAGVIYIFMAAVSMFEVPALIGSPNNIYVFSTLMYESVYPWSGSANYGAAGVYGLFLLIPSIIALQYYQKMIKVSHKYATITGKGYKPKLTDLGRWKWAWLVFVIFYFLVTFIFPLLAILWVSLIPYVQIPTIETLGKVSLLGYQNAIYILSTQGIVGNTIKLVLSVGILSVFLSLIFSWIVIRTRFPGKYALDTISMVPNAIPVIAIAFSVAYLSLLFIRIVPIYGSITAIIIADTILRVPFNTRTINSSLIQIQAELEDAAQICGGSRITNLRMIILPLITPAIFYTFMWSVLNTYRDVTVALFLTGPGNMVISTAIWLNWFAGNSADTAALGVIMVIAMSVIIIILLRIFPQILGERKF